MEDSVAISTLEESLIRDENNGYTSPDSKEDLNFIKQNRI